MNLIPLKYFLISLTIHTALGGFLIYANKFSHEPKTSILITEVILVSNEEIIHREKKSKPIPSISSRKSQTISKINNPKIKTDKKIIEIKGIRDRKELKENEKLIKFQNKKSLEKNEITKIFKKQSSPLQEDKSISQSQISKAVYKLGSIKNPHPPYPIIARKKGLEGRLVLSVKVSKDGSVKHVIIKESSGHKILDIVSKKTVKNWRFTPAKKAGAAIEDSVFVPIRFMLTD